MASQYCIHLYAAIIESRIPTNKRWILVLFYLWMTTLDTLFFLVKFFSIHLDISHEEKHPSYSTSMLHLLLWLKHNVSVQMKNFQFNSKGKVSVS